MNKKQLTLKLSAIAVSILLASCGGGGEGYYGSNDNSGGTTNPETPQVGAASIAIAQNKAELSTGGDSLDLTIRVLDSKGGIIANTPVSLEIVNSAQSGASLSTAANINTDANGLAQVSILLLNQKIEDRLNHDIIIKVKVGSLIQQLSIPATGTSIQLVSDNYSLSVGAKAQVTVTAKDAKGLSLTGAKVKLLDENSNQVIPEVVTVGNDGLAKFNVPASVISTILSKQVKIFAEIEGSSGYLKQRSTDNITLTALTLNDDFSFTSVNQPTKINTNIPISVKVRALNASDLTGKTVSFISTIGTISPSPANITNITQENGSFVGTASAILKGDVSGIATISAKFGNSAISTEHRILAGDPQTVSLSSDAAVLAPNTSTKIFAVVRDLNGSPVQGVPVQFKLTQDTSSTGKLSPASAVTDELGQASVIYTAGAAQTSSNHVQIDAQTLPTTIYPSPRYAQNLTLSVSNQSAFITIAQDQLIASDSVYYTKDFSATVVDTVGRPVVNQPVSVSLVPKTFSKGFYSFAAPDPTKPDVKKWLKTISVSCAVDYAFPAALLSNSGASVGISTTYVTDNQGRFNFKLRYGKNYSTWFTATINAATRVSTKDNLTALAFYAPALADDFDDTGKVAPPNVISPYGIGSDCSDYQ